MFVWIEALGLLFFLLTYILGGPTDTPGHSMSDINHIVMTDNELLYIS